MVALPLDVILHVSLVLPNSVIEKILPVVFLSVGVLVAFGAEAGLGGVHVVIIDFVYIRIHLRIGTQMIDALVQSA